MGCRGGAECEKSGIYHYLERMPNEDLVLFNDLWYLDLNALGITCASTGQCGGTVLPWTQVNVAGSRPTRCFGAGIMIDASDRVFIFGGTAYDSAYAELDHLFVFQLRDPYYKYCSATGAGLLSAQAGVEATFFIQCKDALLRAADGGSFRIDIVGPSPLSPLPIALGGGKYAVRYTPVFTGDYSLAIYVGRGGDKHLDLITGYDTFLENAEHEFEMLGARAPQNPYRLKVSAGQTSPDHSSAQGTALTLCTAGVAAEFTIHLRDSFHNRRPGGELVGVLMQPLAVQLAQSSSVQTAQPTLTGNVADRRDGSYGAGYFLTRSATYRVDIILGGGAGAGSPFELRIAAAVAETSMTYIYGPLLSVATGVASSVYVQTRDRYGNCAESAREDIVFELCITFGSAADNAVASCAGGELESGVGITQEYAEGPTGTRLNPRTGQPYHGLYKTTFFPYNSGSFSVYVKHNLVYINPRCYFDTAGRTGSDMGEQP